VNLNHKIFKFFIFNVKYNPITSDHVANQIAAGSGAKTRFSCKELLENAVDANASDIKLIIKEAGKSLVQ
jgi:DNA mismatch repair ATPase MutL